jgi:hypothetical protein
MQMSQLESVITPEKAKSLIILFREADTFKEANLSQLSRKFPAFYGARQFIVF